MSMTVLDMRTFVREHLDSDSEELPDSLLDVYRREATNRIELSSQRWSFYESEFSFDTVAGDQTYPLTSFSVTIGTKTSYLDSVLGVEGPTWRLDPIGHESARERFAATTYQGRPRWWSLWADTIYLWPTPTAIESFVVRGYRSPLEATASSDLPDLPSEFHTLIAEWMLGRAYMQMDDERMGMQFLAAVEGQLAVLRERYETSHRAGMSIMGGKRRGPAFDQGRLLYPWE